MTIDGLMAIGDMIASCKRRPKDEGSRSLENNQSQIIKPNLNSSDNLSIL
jgi:hypothetical protein